MLFALSGADEEEVLKRAGQQRELHEYVAGVIEERWEEHWQTETDKSWDAMHRALGNGEPDYDPRDALSCVILGGQPLHTEIDYIVVYKKPDEVRRIADAVAAVSNDEMRRRYFAIDQDKYDHPLGDEDCEYTLGWFADVREFYRRAAEGGRAVIFAVDQ